MNDSRYAALAFCLVAMIAALTAPSAPAQDPTGHAGPPPQPVRVDPVRDQTLQHHRLVTGELRPLRSSQVTGQEPGLVQEFSIREGQSVAKGHVLARLDASLLQTEKQQVQAGLEVEHARIRQYEAELELYAWQQEVYGTLVAGGSGQELELRQARANEAATQARIAQARQQIEVFRAQMKLLDQRIEDMTITAPFDGAVVARFTELGQWLNAGDPVVELISVGQVDAWLEIPEELSGAISENNAAGIRVLVESLDRQFQLDHSRIVSRVDTTTRTFSLVSTMNDQKALLKPGMSIVGWAPTGREGDYLTISANALRRNDAGTYVFAVRQQAPGTPEVALPAPVKVRFYFNDRVAVTAATLQSGDRLIVEGGDRLMPGLPVIASPMVAQSQPESVSTPTPTTDLTPQD